MSEVNFIHNKYGYCYYAVGDKTALIYNLYVEPNYRQKGHAENLIRLVIREIRGTGYYGEIQIEAHPKEDSISLENLVRFYERLGLKVISTPKVVSYPNLAYTGLTYKEAEAALKRSGGKHEETDKT